MLGVFNRRFWAEVVLFLALTTDFAFVYMIPILWKDEGVLYFFALVLVCFVSGLAILDFKKVFIYLCTCFFTGAILAAGLYVLPAFLLGELWRVDFAFAALFPTLSRCVVFSLALGVFIALLGCLLGQRIVSED